MTRLIGRRRAPKAVRVVPTDKALRGATSEQLDPDDAPRAALVHTEAVTRPRIQIPPPSYHAHRHQRMLHAMRSAPRKVGGEDVLGWRFRLGVCGRRGGKTLAGGPDTAGGMLADFADRKGNRGRYKALGLSPDWAPGTDKDAEPFLRYWVLAPVQDLLQEPKTRLHQALGGTVEEGGLIVHKDQSRGIWWLAGGIRVDFKSAQRTELLVGRGIDGLWIDEASRVKEEVWRDHLPPQLVDRRAWALFTTTPQGRNWIWRLWCKGDPEEAAILAEGRPLSEILDPDWGVIRWHTADNTMIPGLAEEAERMRRVLPPAMWARNFEATFHAFDGQVYEGLTMARHFAPGGPPPRNQLVAVEAGYDHGWSHKAAIVVVGKDRHGKWWELETVARANVLPYLERGTSWTSIALELQRKWGFRRIHYAPERPEVGQYFERVGITAERAHYADLEALDWMRVALHSDSFKFCSGITYRSFEGLQHPDGGPRAELWVKVDDDEHDATLYACSSAIEAGVLGTVDRAYRGLVHPLRRV